MLLAFVAMCILIFDEFLLEFRRCFQKMDNNMDICRMRCQILRHFPEMYETEQIIDSSIHLFDSFLSQTGVECPVQPPRRCRYARTTADGPSLVARRPAGKSSPALQDATPRAWI